jgi:hypothetical protein
MKNIFEKIRENRGVVLKHILGWLVYIMYLDVVLIRDFEFLGGWANTMIATVSSHIFCAINFYTLSFYLYPIFFAKKYKESIVKYCDSTYYTEIPC